MTIADPTDPARPPRSIVPGVAAVVGLAMVGWGVVVAFREADDTHPLELAAWAVGADLVHDLIALPLALGVLAVVYRVLPRFARVPVTWGLATSAVLVVFGWPFLRGYGRNPTVPSLLNRDYPTGVAVYLGLIWGAVAIWLLVRRRSPREGK